MKDKYLRPIILLLMLGITVSVAFPTIKRVEDGFANNYVKDDDDTANKTSSHVNSTQSLIAPAPYILPSSIPSVPSSEPVSASIPSYPQEQYSSAIDDIVIPPEPMPDPPVSESSAPESSEPSSLPESSESVSSDTSSEAVSSLPKPDFDKIRRDRLLQEVKTFAADNNLSVTVSETLHTLDIPMVLTHLKQFVKFLPSDLLNDFGITIILTDAASPIMIGSTVKIAYNEILNKSIIAAIEYMANEVEQSGIEVDFTPLNPPDFETVGISEGYLFNPATPGLSYFSTMRAQHGGAVELSELFIEMIDRRFRFVRLTPEYPLYYKFKLVCPLLCERYPSLKQTKMGQIYS